MRLYQRLTNGCPVGRVPRLTVALSAMRAILFDLDGTLIDSAALITRHLAVRCGPSAPRS